MSIATSRASSAASVPSVAIRMLFIVFLRRFPDSL
jgi:hypothetical protein